MDSKRISDLTKPLPMYTKPGPGRTVFKFFKGEDVIARLNSVFDYEWSSEVLSTERIDDFVIVRVRLTVPVGPDKTIHKEGFGGAPVMRNKTTGDVVDFTNVFKSAFTSAIKKAAEQLGIGLLEEQPAADTHDTQEPPRRVAPPSPPVNRASVPQRQEPGRAVSSAVISVATPPAPVVSEPENEELARAEKILKDAAAAATSSQPAPRPVEAPAPKSSPFPKSEAVAASDKISDVQLGALEKLCSTTGRSLTTLIVDAVADGVLGADKKERKLTELSRLDGAVLVRYLSTKVSMK